MDGRALADFLRSRRERIQPAEVGLPDSGRRRTPGLRRAEVAQLAGISPDYYVRLEQGRKVRPSPGVLDAHLRAAAAQDPDDPATRALIGELSVKSRDFQTWWARHDVAVYSSGRKVLQHPAVGRLVLDYQAFQIPNTPDQQLVLYTAPAGSPSQHALDLLDLLSRGDGTVDGDGAARRAAADGSPQGAVASSQISR